MTEITCFVGLNHAKKGTKVLLICRPRVLSLIRKLSSHNPHSMTKKTPKQQQRNVQKQLLGWQRCWLRGAARPLDWMTAWGLTLGAHPGQ